MRARVNYNLTAGTEKGRVSRKRSKRVQSAGKSEDLDSTSAALQSGPHSGHRVESQSQGTIAEANLNFSSHVEGAQRRESCLNSFSGLYPIVADAR